MNVNEIATKVFCSFCDSVTSDFIEWGDEFYCVQYCLDYLPTPEAMEAERSEREANSMARELSNLMDEVEALGGAHTSAGSTDETMIRIEHLANWLSWFYPDKLDNRFK